MRFGSQIQPADVFRKSWLPVVSFVSLCGIFTTHHRVTTSTLSLLEAPCSRGHNFMLCHTFCHRSPRSLRRSEKYVPHLQVLENRQVLMIHQILRTSHAPRPTRGKRRCVRVHRLVLHVGPTSLCLRQHPFNRPVHHNMQPGIQPPNQQSNQTRVFATVALDLTREHRFRNKNPTSESVG